MLVSNSDKHTKYIADNAPDGLKKYICNRGYRLISVDPVPTVTTPISAHPDIQMCRLGCMDDNLVVKASCDELLGMSGVYPDDIRFNAACTGKFFIHNLHHTQPRLLEEALSFGMTPVNVKQGYTKCSTVIVDENSIITYDAGIAEKCREADISVLLISPGNVRLSGYSTGFIGGTSGRLGNEIIFNGSLNNHPDGNDIRRYIESRGLKCTDFDWPLEDIGSII